MSNRQKDSREDSTSVARRFSEELSRRWTAVNDTLKEGKCPSNEDLEAIERFSKLKGLLPPTDSRRRLDVGVLCVAALLMLICTFLRLSSTEVDLDVRATRVRVTLAGHRSELLIPGELGEILELREAHISGAEQVLPPPVDQSAIVELRQVTSPNGEAGPQHQGTFPVRLQEVALPSDIPFTLTIGIAYALSLRGLSLETSGAMPAKAQFGEVIEVGSSAIGANGVSHAIRPVIVRGRNLSMELFPVQTGQSLTVLRDVEVSDISFENHGHSSILSGSAAVKSGAFPIVTVQPSDRLDIRSNIPMLVRELTFDKGAVKARLTAPEATTITAGDSHPRNLMPTLFDWLQYRWSTQLWGAISALATLWFAIQRWWSPSK